MLNLKKQNIIFYPRSKNYPPFKINENLNLEEIEVKGLKKEYQRLVNIFTIIFPDAEENCEVDFEDWIENVHQLNVLLNVIDKQSSKYNGFVPVKDKYLSLNLGDVCISRDDLFKEINNIWFIGSIPKILPFITKQNFSHLKIIPSKNSENIIDRYFTLETFKKYANRDIYIGNFKWGSDNYFQKLIKNLPNNKYILKSCIQKEISVVEIDKEKDKVDYSFLFDLEKTIPSHEIETMIGYTSVRREEDEFGVIIQDKIDMQYEYRIIVKNHKIVSGAGIIEEFTPLNRTTWNSKGKPYYMFDPVMKKYKDSNLEFKFGLLNKYYTEANKMIEDFKKETPQMDSYILDIALSDDEVVIVELNPFHNYGLYANDFNLVLN